MPHIKILSIQERTDGRWYVTCQRDCPGGSGEVENRTVYFDGPNPAEELRIWLSLQAEIDDVLTDKRDALPTDLAELVGKPVDTAELRQRFKPQLDAHKERAEN